MSAAEAIMAARAAGVSLGIDGDDLVLEAPRLRQTRFSICCRRHKADIVALLRPRRNGWLAEDWHAFFDGRVAIAELAGRLPRPEAEARAFACCIAEWLNRNPVRSSPDRCLGCGTAEDADNVLLPFGVEGAAHLWLHSRCWPAWYGRRKVQAFAALVAMGIAPPANFPDDFGKNGTCMMGGLGSGRPSGSGRDKVEACRAIDVNHLQRTGCLRPGWSGGWQWTRDGERVAWISMRSDPDRLHLSYRVRSGGSEWQDVAETVRIVRVPCRLRRRAAVFRLPRRCERDRLRPARRQAARVGTLFPVPALLSLGACQPERGRLGPHAAARQQAQATPWRRCRNGLALSAEAEGDVAADLRETARTSL